MQRIRRFFIWFLCGLLSTQSLAQSATTLLQEPPFTPVDPAPNVMVMFDDSGSMGGHALPGPSWKPSFASGTTVSIRGLGPDAAGVWQTRTWNIAANEDFLLRAPAFNPLWYNPAIRYQPWNKDGTRLPAASIGGNVPTANHGAITSRANAAALTERDPRQVPVSTTTYQSVTPLAGGGLLGTDRFAPMSDPQLGRLITGFSPNVAFRYHRMAYDFGPAPAGSPHLAHVDMNWTTHDDVNSPLDLFSKPVISTNLPTICTPQTVMVTAGRSGCFTGTAACQTNQPALPLNTSTSWSRQNCDGSTSSYTSDPGPLTCYRAACPSGTNATWTPWQTGSAPSLSCDWQRPTCDGSSTTFISDPGPLTCPWRRPGCDNTYTGAGAVASSATNPGNLICYQARACSNPMGSWGTWSTTNPGAGAACYQRQSCAGDTEFFLGDPGSLSCPVSRQNCFGAVESFATNPGSLTCWSRNTCSGVNQVFTSDPGFLACGYKRQNCLGTTESFASDPGSLTCRTRRNCDGTTTGPTSSPLASVTCSRGDDSPVIYSEQIWTNTSRFDTNNAQTFTRSPTGGGLRLTTLVPTVNTVTRSAIAPDTFTPVRLTANTQSQTLSAVANTTATCPVGSTNLSCTATFPEVQTVCTPGAAVTAPNPEALTPARYYAYTGTGSNADPANYRVVQIDRTRPTVMTMDVVDAVTGIAATAASSQRTDCAARTTCTWLEEAQNYANWYTYYRNRMFSAQAVMFDALSSLRSTTQQQVRIGFGRINHYNGAMDAWRSDAGGSSPALTAIDGFTNPGALVRGVRAFAVGSPERTHVFEWLQSLAWYGFTPNREALDSAGRYFSWNDSRGPWGATPGTANPSQQLSCRRNFTLLTTDGEWTAATGLQPILSATAPLGGPGSPFNAARTDGPTIQGDGSQSAATFTWRPGDWLSYTGGDGATGTLTDVATYYWNRDLRPDLPNTVPVITDPLRANPAFWQSMSSFVVGFGLNATMDTPATRASIAAGQAVAWPATDTSSAVAAAGNRVNDNMRAALTSRGNFYAAASVDELRNGILSAFEQLLIRQGAAGGVATTGPSVTADSLAFFPSYVSGLWSGTLRAFSNAELQGLSTGTSATATWTANAPASTARRIYTATAINSGTDFAAGSLNATQLAQLSGGNFSSDEFINWLRGDTSLERTTPALPGQKFRTRSGPFGDFVNSAPVFVRAPDYGYSSMGSIGSGYNAYVTARRTAGPGTVYIGGNAGMMHAFNAQNGTERFAYVPRGVYPNLSELADPGYRHRYYVDGQITAGDFHDGTRWRSAIVGSTGAGGASLFAIDTSDPTAVTASSVMWDLTRDDHADVGHILGRGFIGRVRAGPGPNNHRWVYINGNGYESQNNRAALLVVDLLTGSVTSIPVGPSWTPADGLAARNGMGTPTVRYDGQRNIVGVYAGDKQGNVWRFDFSSGIPTGARGFDDSNTALFTATDASGTRQPITAAPRLTLHPLGGLSIVFGTGKLIDQDDTASTSAQALYGLWEKPTHTAAITRSQLAALSIQTDVVGNRSFAVNGIDWRTQMGWRMDMSGGERVVADPSLELGLLSISSFKPGAIVDPCEGGGQSNLYQFDLVSGLVRVAEAPGMVSGVTPVLSLTAPTRNKSQGDLSAAMRGVVLPQAGSGAPPPSQCTLYGSAIQGRPSVIARTCPAFAPMRVWRQPLR